jgi:ABC-type sugar transport system substrate-binding protein
VVSGSFKPVVVGMNASPEGIDGVKNGQLLATFSQRPVEVGNGLAFAAKQVLDGKQVPKTVLIQMPEYDASNVDSWIPPEEQLKSPLTVTFPDQGGDAVLKTTGK